MPPGQKVIFAFRQRGKICIQANMQDLPAGVQVNFAFRLGMKDARNFLWTAYRIKIALQME